MSKEEELYHQTGQSIADATQSQMFGKPCYKINGKAFISFFQNCLVCKLSGNVHQEALALDGASLFDPSGKKRPMKEWVQIPYHHRDRWQYFARSACEYVAANS